MEAIDDDLATRAAVLVEDRLLRRIIKRHRHVEGFGLRVPHAHGYSLPSADLAELVEPGELAVDLARLPDTRVAVLSGDRAALTAGRPAAWIAAWRALFHLRVHDAIDARIAGGELSPARIREHIHALGQTEFDEVRLVLRQEDLVLPPGDDTTVYAEFAALYLELRHFAPAALDRTFPSLTDRERVDQVLARDVDAAAVLAAARPPRAPADPLATAAPRGRRRRARVGPWTGSRLPARHAADAARRRGNLSRAAILACRADDVELARADLTALIERLGRALGDPPVEGWVDALLPVARTAAQRGLRYSAEARLLVDLQAACVDAERDVEVVDAWTWARTLGKRAIVRTLPATREVRVARRVRAASRKLPRCALDSPLDRERLAATVHAMVEHANQNVRTVLRPRIEAAFTEVELEPRNLPERVALKKIVDELLDRAVAVGRLSIGDLRDAISHNDLKLEPLGPVALVRGDQLLRVDRMLAGELDGVYRRGEIYMRFLQKVSSVLAGNRLGRPLTLYLLLPLVASFFVVEGLQHTVAPIAGAMGRVAPEISNRTTLLAVAGLVFLLLHVAGFRAAVFAGLRWLGATLWAGLSAVGRGLRHIPLIVPIMRWLLVPAMPAGLAVLLLPAPARWIAGGALMVATAAVLNSRAAEELVADWIVRSGRQLARRIVPGLIKYALELFAWLIELVERGIYRVDERLRFRPNQSPVVAVIKGVLGTIWFAVAYVLRIYVNLLVEPTVNPIKHFPVVTVAAKLILPFTPVMVTTLTDATSGVLGPALGASLAAFTVLVLPGVAGFLAWELNGNWQLYGHNRADHLRPIKIGSHGETVGALLRPGFHSGTAPKLHAKLRRATWNHDPRAEARCREGLHHVEEAVWRFADRQLVSMLNQDLSFDAADVAVDHVEVRSNRLRIELVCPSAGPGHATIAFEEQSGWIVAGIPEPGWLDGLPPSQRDAFEVAVIGFYKLAGVELVREQLEAALATGGLTAPAYDITDDGLVVWPGSGFDVELVWNLDDPSLPVRVRGGRFDGAVPVLAGRSAIFARARVRWDDWVTTWERLSFGMQPRRLIAGPSLLPPAGRGDATPAAAAP